MRISGIWTGHTHFWEEMSRVNHPLPPRNTHTCTYNRESRGEGRSAPEREPWHMHENKTVVFKDSLTYCFHTDTKILKTLNLSGGPSQLQGLTSKWFGPTTKISLTDTTWWDNQQELPPRFPGSVRNPPRWPGTVKTSNTTISGFYTKKWN